MVYGLLILCAIGLFAAVAWRDRPLGLALVAAALPTYLLRFSLGGVPGTLLEGLMLVLAAIWVIRGEWKRVRDLPRPWLIVVAAMVAAAALATVTSADRHAAFGILKAYFVEPVLLFFVAVTTLKRPEDKERVLLAFGLGAAACSLLGLFQFATALGIPAPWDVERRVTGPFPYPNALGLYAGPALVLAALKLAGKTERKELWGAVATLCALGIVLAQSEAAAAAVLATLFLASLFSKAWRRVTVPLAAAGLALAFLVPATRHYLTQKLAFQDYSEQVRLGQWQETWSMLKDRPVFGAGLAGYRTAFAPYHARTQDEIFQYPHTLLLNVWSELGLAGLAAFAALAWITVQSVRRRSDSAAVLAFAALAESAIHGLADVPYFKNDLAALTWILLAVIAASTTYGKAISLDAKR